MWRPKAPAGTKQLGFTSSRTEKAALPGKRIVFTNLMSILGEKNGGERGTLLAMAEKAGIARVCS
jgi:hypothetical protein